VLKYAGIALCALVLSGCGLLYTNIRLPYSYYAATPGDVHADKEDPTATGQACNRSVLYLVAWGDAGYASAVRKALESYPKSTYYDVKMDVKVQSYVLGLYTKSCTIVTGKVTKP
jgi:TRL (tRNA-associated locus)-like protein